MFVERCGGRILLVGGKNKDMLMGTIFCPIRRASSHHLGMYGKISSRYTYRQSAPIAIEPNHR